MREKNIEVVNKDTLYSFHLWRLQYIACAGMLGGTLEVGVIFSLYIAV